jgi:hypothetical protein
MSLKSKLAKALYGKSSVPAKKRKIFEQAEKDIQYMQGAETAATKDVKRQTGAESDIDKAIRARARKARKDLANLRM